ncbi:MAG: 30S ribosomal protein S27e [Candidatus Aenigmarchaeota archaeon]|nr:30S ribosomal protein S27e [Candidatus Aenigmarchaeota archaeon]MBS3054631.1 30S ribosomal protein S27e [Candidatus Aenigmarchaeota archaeon]
MQTSRFLKVKCGKCKNEQITYSKASTIVTCLVCGEQLVQPAGGVARILAQAEEL